MAIRADCQKDHSWPIKFSRQSSCRGNSTRLRDYPGHVSGPTRETPRPAADVGGGLWRER